MSKDNTHSVHPSTGAESHPTSKRGSSCQPGKSNEKSVTAHRDELAQLLYQLFRGRQNDLLVGDAGAMRHEQVGAPLRPERIRDEHLAQHKCLGVYPILDSGTVYFSAADFDSKPSRPDPDWRSKVELVYMRLKQLQLFPLAEISQSGQGAHLWLFHVEIAAWIVRRAWRLVFEDVGISQPEIFPRQDSLAAGKIGNAIRLPLFGKSRFVDIEHNWRTTPPLVALQSITRTSLADLQSAAARLGYDISTPPERKRTSPRLTTDVSLPSCVTQLVNANPNGLLARRWRGETAGMHDSSRSAIAFSIAVLLIRAYVPTVEIEDALRGWCDSIGYHKGSKSDWIDLTIQNAYDQVFSDHIQLLRSRIQAKLPKNTPRAIRSAHHAAAAKHRRSKS
jgi:hypothetical protein